MQKDKIKILFISRECEILNNYECISAFACARGSWKHSVSPIGHFVGAYARSFVSLRSLLRKWRFRLFWKAYERRFADIASSLCGVTCLVEVLALGAHNWIQSPRFFHVKLDRHWAFLCVIRRLVDWPRGIWTLSLCLLHRCNFLSFATSSEKMGKYFEKTMLWYLRC